MKRRFNASAKRATTKASESNKTLTITIPKESETMKTAIKATSSGKLHLSNFETGAICVKNNKTMKFVEVLPYESALKADKSAFCKRCFGDEDPHKVIKEMMKLADDDESKRAPVKKKLTTVDATESMQKKLAEKAQNVESSEAFNLDIKYIYDIIERLRERKDGEFNTKYMKRKARFRWECMQVVIEMLETGNKKVLERLIME